MKLPRYCEFRLRTKLVYGDGSRGQVTAELEKLGATDSVLFTDKGLVSAGVAGMMSAAFEGSSVKLLGTFDAIEQDAKLSVINRAAEFARSLGARGLVALGGGSVMDTVKGVNYLLSTGEKDLRSLMPNPMTIVFDAKPLLPSVAVPTTAGTGAELSPAAVIMDEEKKVKGILFHQFCSSDSAILDPELTVSLPPKLTAMTGFDALTHAIEGATSRTANPFGSAQCYEAMKIIRDYLPRAVKDGKNIEARGYMLIAASLAMLGYVAAPGGAVHAMAHAIGGLFGIPHGLANAILLPYVLEYNLDHFKGKLIPVASNLGVDVRGLQEHDAGGKAIMEILRLRKESGLPSTLKEAGIPREGLAQASEQAMGDMTMPLNPRPASQEEIHEVFIKAWG